MVSKRVLCGSSSINLLLHVKVKRVYLVHITQLEPRRLDLETVWVLDGETRSIYKAQVDRNTDSQDPAEMILRIRYVPLRF